MSESEFNDLWEKWIIDREKLSAGVEMSCAVYFYTKGKRKGIKEIYEELHTIYGYFWRGPKIEFQVNLIKQFGDVLKKYGDTVYLMGDK